MDDRKSHCHGAGHEGNSGTAYDAGAGDDVIDHLVGGARLHTGYVEIYRGQVVAV